MAVIQHEFAILQPVVRANQSSVQPLHSPYPFHMNSKLVFELSKPTKTTESALYDPGTSRSTSLQGQSHMLHDEIKNGQM